MKFRSSFPIGFCGSFSNFNGKKEEGLERGRFLLPPVESHVCICFCFEMKSCSIITNISIDTVHTRAKTVVRRQQNTQNILSKLLIVFLFKIQMNNLLNKQTNFVSSKCFSLSRPQHTLTNNITPHSYILPLPCNYYLCIIYYLRSDSSSNTLHFF